MASKKELFLVVSGTTILGESESDELAQTGAKELAVASGKFTQVMSPEELNERAYAWAQNDKVRENAVENISAAIQASAEHTFNRATADVELEKQLRHTYRLKYMSSTFDPSKIANAVKALWASPRHTRVREDGSVTTGFRILNIAKSGGVLSARPGGQRKSQVEWILLEYAKILMSNGKGISEIVAEVV